MPPSPVSAASRPHANDHPDEPPTPTVRHPPQRPSEPCPRADAAHDHALAEACRHARPGTPNDRVLYIGLNEESAGIEARALAAGGVSLECVLGHAGSSVGFDGTSYDLT